MRLLGGCHCGAVRYSVTGEPQHILLCHCADCRKNTGAPMVAWASFAGNQLTLTQGETKTFISSKSILRSFCGDCGTGLFYRNEAVWPGIVDIQSVTLDDPNALPPTAHIQTAERVTWLASAHELPSFEGFPD